MISTAILKKVPRMLSHLKASIKRVEALKTTSDEAVQHTPTALSGECIKITRAPLNCSQALEQHTRLCGSQALI